METSPQRICPKEHENIAIRLVHETKENIKMQKVYKWKARLNIHGGKQVYGVNYTDTFSPVVTWITVRLILILSIIYKGRTRQVDFVLAFP